MEQKHAYSLGCGCLIGLIMGWMGMFFYVGYLFAEGCRHNRPHTTIEKATLQRVDIDGNIPDSMNLYLLSITRKDSSETGETDSRCLDSVYVTDKNNKRIEKQFKAFYKVNNREFSRMKIESPLLFREYEIQVYGEGSFTGQLENFRNGSNGESWLFSLPKNCTLPKQMTFKFEKAEIRGEVINTPLKCNIMSIDYTELPQNEN